MAGRGSPPKPPEQRQRRNSPSPVTELDAEPGEVDAPPLEGDYLPQTVAWWNTWRHSAQAVLFTSTDWQRLLMLAPIVDLYFRDPSQSLLAEIRLNEAKLGATPEDRARLHWRIAPPTGDQMEIPEEPPTRKPDPRVTAAKN